MSTSALGHAYCGFVSIATKYAYTCICVFVDISTMSFFNFILVYCDYYDRASLPMISL